MQGSRLLNGKRTVCLSSDGDARPVRTQLDRSRTNNRIDPVFRFRVRGQPDIRLRDTGFHALFDTLAVFRFGGAGVFAMPEVEHFGGKGAALAPDPMAR